MELTYNCWHGCHKKSEGCLNCYVYSRDESIGKDASIVYKTKSFDMPIQKDRSGNYKYPSGTCFMMCFSSDFFVEEADAWRNDVLNMIKTRSDCDFICITKRPERIKECIPDLSTYSNLDIFCTCENQIRFDERVPIYLESGVKYKVIIMEPLLGPIDLSTYINRIDFVSVGGESGLNARVCDFNWVKDIRKQCKKHQVDFDFRQTGAKLLVDGKLYKLKKSDQLDQAQKAFKD